MGNLDSGLTLKAEKRGKKGNILGSISAPLADGAGKNSQYSAKGLELLSWLIELGSFTKFLENNMNFMRRTRNGFLSIALTVVLAIAIAGFAPIQTLKASAAPLQLTAPTLADVSANSLKRRAEGAAEELSGKTQRAFGDAADSPRNEMRGSTRQYSGQAKQNIEDAKDSARDVGRQAREEAREMQENAKNLGDRIKDFFD